MDTDDFFRSLQGGASFNRKRFGSDIGVFEKGNKHDHSSPIGAAKAATRMQRTSLDFFHQGTSSGLQDEGEGAEEEESEHRLPPVTNEKKRKRTQEEEECDQVDTTGDKENGQRKAEKQESGRKRRKEQLQRYQEISRFRRQHRIKVTGSDPPEPLHDFAELESRFGKEGMWVAKKAAEVGYEEPTAIQRQALASLLAGREVMAVAPTGSGKTASYLLPILAKLKEGKKGIGFRALILVPAKELAQQIYREALHLTRGSSLRTFVLTKSNATKSHFGPQTTQRFDILVATPLRLVQMIRTDSIQLHSVEHLVLDEVDRLFDMGFVEQADQVIAACDNENIQRSLWTATMPQVVEELSQSFLRNPLHIFVGARNAATTTIKQTLKFVGKEENKLAALRQIIQEGIRPPVLIFVQSKERAQELFQELAYDNLNVDVIHADKSQTKREGIVKKFRMGKIWFLITTDLMARGMDFHAVSCVINYDFPQNSQTYIHRIGRSGRAGKEGSSITFYTENDAEMLRSIANIMKNSGCPVPEWMLALKKPSKSKKKEMERKPPKRGSIKTVSKYDLKQAKLIRQQRKKLKQQQQQHTTSNNGNEDSQV
ncbi:DEAD (Asp-Glu-Ala-Asp) box polypeptide 52 [Balamuthia mandrillaris]